MLLIKTHIAPSSIHGLGVFVDEFVPKGTKVWEWTDGIDIIVPQEIVNKLSNIQRQFIETYAWKESNQFHLCTDNARFINHSDSPTILSISGCDISIQDIHPGEELTTNYWKFHEGDKL